MFPTFEASDRIGAPTVKLLASLFQPEMAQQAAVRKGTSSADIHVLPSGTAVAAGKRRSLF
jgi:hypothetical protein